MYDAIVLAGGAARRLDGVDKPGVEVGGVPLLERVLRATAGASRTVIVGTRRDVGRDVIWTREEPAGSGPVAAMAAGLALTRAPTVLVLAADLPWIAGADPPLRAALAGHDVALLVDEGGRVNLLAGAWRRASLIRALAALGDPRDAAVRRLTAGLDVVLVQDVDGWGRDCDTWSDVRAADERAADERAARRAGGTPVTGPALDGWVVELANALGVDPDTVDATLLLDVARDAAHGVARPAAPLTTFLVGLAAGLRGGDRQAIAEAAAVAQQLATER